MAPGMREFPWIEPPLPLRDDRGVADFGREDVGGEQLVDAVAVFLASSNRLGRVRLGNLPLHGGRAIDDVFHSTSRISPTMSAAISWTPNFSSICLRTGSARSLTLR